MQIVHQDDVQKKIIEINGKKILIDADVAELYGLETREIKSGS